MKKILFVCLGNICRSPAAHGIFQKMLEKNGLQNAVQCDSCGTGDWHIGSLPDRRMRDAGTRHGYKFDHRARQFDPAKDFQNFDLILTMDLENLRDVQALARDSRERQKVQLFTHFCTGDFANSLVVEDPYFSSVPAAFDNVIEQLENGCAALILAIQRGEI